MNACLNRYPILMKQVILGVGCYPESQSTSGDNNMGSDLKGLKEYVFHLKVGNATATLSKSAFIYESTMSMALKHDNKNLLSVQIGWRCEQLGHVLT